MSDDIELNVDTLEPEEEAVSEEEYSCGQRVPMRKPATLVQYWINTGNPPYKVLLDENELSETGSSLSEKEITSPSTSLFPNVVNAVNTSDAQKHKNDSSCSSVDTAAYILSNANITKKADTIAIIEGAKCVQVKSLKDVSIKDIGVPSNNKNEYIEIAKIDHAIRDRNVDAHIDGPDIELYPMSTEYTVSKICDRTTANTLVFANAVHSNMYSQGLSSEETDKMNKSSTSQRNLDVQTIDDIASIFRQFQDKTSKRLIGNNKNNDASNQDNVLEMDIFHEKQVSNNIAQDTLIAKDMNVTAFHRKKLYTGRDSPVDLILTETHGISRLSGARQSLHPALDPDATIKRKTFLVHKGRNKCSLSAKRSLGSKRVKKKERRDLSCISNKTITDNTKYTNNDQIQDSNINSPFKNLSDFHDNLDRQDDIPFQEYNDTNISVTNEKCKQSLPHFKLKPVLLEQIKPSCKLKSGENTHIAQKKSVHNNRHSNKFKKLYSCEIENLELETIDSDGSTILICKCNMNASQRASSLNDCSVDLREKLNIEDEFSASIIGKKDDKLSSLKDTDMNRNKKHVEGLSESSNKDYTNAAMESQVLNKSNAIWQNVLSNKSKTHSCLYRKSKIDNVKLREIKVVLERLPLSVKNYTNTVMEMEMLNENDATWQKEISNKSKTHSSHPYGANKKDNVKFREIRVVLERLPSNVCLKESSNVTNTNIFPNTSNKKKIQNTDLETNHKREPQIRNISKISACENVTAVRPVCNNYSMRMNTKSKKKNDKISDTFEVVVEHGNQVFDKVESDSTFQHEASRHRNRNKTSQDNRRKYSVLTFTSSDEDDFVQSIQHPRKRSKVSINDNILGESNIAEKNLCDRTKLINIEKEKYHYSGNLSTVIRSSEKTIQRDIGLIKEKKEDSRIVEINSFSKTQTATASLRKNERFVFFSSEDDNDSVADNSDKHKKRISFFDRNRNINNNSKGHSSEAIERNDRDRKDNVHVIFFQTKIFDTNSSDSEESNSYTPATCKALKSSSILDRLRYHNYDNSEKIFNDSIANKYSKRHLNSLNSFEKHNLIYDVKTRSKLINKEANKQLPNELSNGNIKSRISDTRKDMTSSSLINDIRDASVQEKMFSNTFLEETNLDSLPENKAISNNSKNSIVIQQDDVTSTVRKLLTFQTKNYYDSSDSSEIS